MKKEERYYYYLTPDGKGYRIHRRPDNRFIEGALLNTKAAAVKDAKRRVKALEMEQAA